MPPLPKPTIKKLKNREEALKFINKALEFSPNNLNYQESRDTILNS